MSRAETKKMDFWFFFFYIPGIAVLGGPFPGVPTPRPHIQMATLPVVSDYTGSFQVRSSAEPLYFRLVID